LIDRRAPDPLVPAAAARETGLLIYGAAGPSLVQSSGSELGLSLTVGVHLHMKSGRRYNGEHRFGFGDIPEHKVVPGVFFGI